MKGKKGEKILELPLAGKCKLIVYLDKNHERQYNDSLLYFFDGKKEHGLTCGSFAFDIGYTLCKRIYSVASFSGESFEKLLDYVAMPDFSAKFSRYCLTACADHGVYIYREGGTAMFCLYKLKIKKDKVKYKKLFRAEISEDILQQWRTPLGDTYISRYIIELKKCGKTDGQIEKACKELMQTAELTEAV